MEIPSNLWQSQSWATFRNTVGNNAFFRKYENATALIIERTPHKFKFWKKPYWEIPRGPIGKSDDFEGLLEFIFQKAKEHNIERVRVYPPFIAQEVKLSGITTNFWKWCTNITMKYRSEVAPEIFSRDTLILSLLPSEEELLAQMKQKGRYNIKLAQKKGVKVITEKNTDTFFSLLEQTAKRDKFIPNKKEVYDQMLDSFADNALLLTATLADGTPLASAIFVIHDQQAYYYYGSSSNEHREYMAPYLLQWDAIRWAKAKRATSFDFLGISPEGDTKHRLHGVSQFKEKFGGTRIQYEEGRDFLIS